MIYLDYSATTPTDSDVLDTFVKASKYIGNAELFYIVWVVSQNS